MLKNKIQYLIVGVASIFLIGSCGTSKKIKWGSEDVLFVSQCYTQTHVPGVEDAEPINYLFVQMDGGNLESVTIDSVYYTQKMHRIFNPKKVYRLDLSKGKEASFGDEGLVFYHTEDGTFKTPLSKIEEKETLYMP